MFAEYNNNNNNSIYESGVLNKIYNLKAPNNQKEFLNWSECVESINNQQFSNYIMNGRKEALDVVKKIYELKEEYRKKFGLKFYDENKLIVLSDSEEKLIVKIQRGFRRKVLIKNQEQIFKQEPNKQILLSDNWKEFEKDINGLKGNVVTTIKHLTTLDNFASIISNGGTMYGRLNLVSSQIEHQGMCLSKGDIINGDGNVICFGTDELDHAVGNRADLLVEGKMNDVLGDLSDKFHGFCKISDLLFRGSILKEVKSGDWIIKYTKFNRECGPGDVTIFNNKLQRKWCIPLVDNKNKHQALFYDLSKIDQFFGSYIFGVIDRIGDDELTKTFKNYLSQMDDKSRQKFLIDVSKALSSCSEINISGGLKLDFDKLNIGFIREGIVVGDMAGENFKILLGRGTDEIAKYTADTIKAKSIRKIQSYLCELDKFPNISMDDNSLQILYKARNLVSNLYSQISKNVSLNSSVICPEEMIDKEYQTRLEHKYNKIKFSPENDVKIKILQAALERRITKEDYEICSLKWRLDNTVKHYRSENQKSMNSLKKARNFENLCKL